MSFAADPQAIEEQLRRILESRVFAGARRSRSFLRYVVERSLMGGPDGDGSLKEYAIATDVFGQSASYDPAVDATVRVEAGRLRGRLREYYMEEGQSDRLVIEMPKGGYRVLIRERVRVARGPDRRWGGGEEKDAVANETDWFGVS
jgi:hypothetical protein